MPREGTIFPAMGVAGVPGRTSKTTLKHWATMDDATFAARGSCCHSRGSCVVLPLAGLAPPGWTFLCPALLCTLNIAPNQGLLQVYLTGGI